MSVENLRKEMDDLVSEVKSHNDLLKSISDVLDKAVEKTNEEKNNLEVELDKKNQEISLLEKSIIDKKTAIKKFNDEITEITPKFKSQEEMINDIGLMVADLETKAKGLKESIAEYTDKQRNLDNEISEKTEARNSLMSSIDVKVAANEKVLQEAKDEQSALSKKYVAMDFLFDKIETPEVEIMAIVVANSPISTDEIKGKAKSVLPIFVGRAITKLEADGKIVSNGEKWVLSPTMLEKL